MTKFQSIPAFAIAIALSLATAAHAQNPPMNCAADGIIQVCTLADSSSTPVEAAAPAAPVQPVPHVTYKDGQLTIMAENVPLSDVLREVSSKTGAAIELPDGSASEPVFANIGPGSVRDVLVALLNGTKFNYVMLGSQDASNTLEKIVLTSSDKPKEVAESSAPVVAPAPKAPVAATQSPEERRAAFMAAVQEGRGAAMQKAQEKYAELAAKGLMRASDSTTDSQPAPTPGTSQVQAPATPPDSENQ